MRKPIILYISNNDGTDTRISKELFTLSKSYKIIFIGVGRLSENFFSKDFCEKVFLIPGRRNSIVTISRQVLLCLKLLIFKRISSIHIINEQLAIFFWPFFFFKPAVLDVFDSIFLMKNLPNEKLLLVKKIFYAPFRRVIVTDKERLMLMPKFLQSKCLILPNYPFYFKNTINKEQSSYLRILYNGWMGKNRGTEIVEGLLNSNENIHVFMAGWFSDDYTKNLVDRFSSKITYLGLLKQRKVLEIIAEKIDFILCVYSPIEVNNIYASPNKIYDGIQTGTPLIINEEIKISTFIRENNLGIVIPQYKVNDFKKLYQQLLVMKNNFVIPEHFSKLYCWENVENVLITSHQLDENTILY